jgi:type IV secretory pathway TrbD component
MDHPREAVFHQSINRPNLMMGGDREMVLFAALISGLVGFTNMTSWWGLVIAALFFPCAIWGLTRMAKEDPLMRKVYISHMRYGRFYPAKAPLHREGSTTPMSWR